MIGNWLKKKLRGWLLTEEELAPKPYLDCLVDGKVITYRITGSHGFLLWGSSAEGTRLVGHGISCDHKHFWRLWDYFNEGNKMEWVEEPGDAQKGA